MLANDVKQYLGITPKSNDLEVAGRMSGLVAAMDTENEK